MTIMLDTPSTGLLTACAADPDRWLVGGSDPQLKRLCRACPRRWTCAREALNFPGAQGMWAGVHLPATGRDRRFALRQLRSLVEYSLRLDPDPAAG
jgi:WhiB family redox-sensing transcriptional regulator